MNHYKTATSKTHGVMIDIETMGKGPDAALASIAAVPFPYEVEEPLSWLAEVMDSKAYFYKNISLEMQVGRSFDGGTVKWWLMQNDAARQALTSDATIPLVAALKALKEFWPNGYPAYSKGATFDLVILSHAYDQLGETAPWDYNQGLCARTVFEISGVGKPKVDILNNHNALDDALLQAIWFQRAWKSLLVPPTYDDDLSHGK